ncbi:hypothetical protein ACJIZ3_021666 [Penstemon smallii]|uniref:HRDC domain-containing protein n=1 Tax=Penstemon smallii TaxID=265156 RepID=A0ABD3SMX5_9LAMI
MEIDIIEEENPTKSEALRNLTANGTLPISIAKLSGSSRVIPSHKSFHFYNNFQDFKNPVKVIDENSKTLLKKIGASEKLFGKAIDFPDDREIELDDDVALDWLVNVNDEIFERFDVSLDEFKGSRKREEESGVRNMRVDDEDDGFQMVYGKKNKKLLAAGKNVENGRVKGVQEVKVATKLKPKIPFHVPTITKPQDEYKIIVNNSNQPFDHVWLQKREDGSGFVHPLEKLSVLDFVDTSDSIAEPVKPPPLELTPFKFVEEVKDLKQMAVKLRGVDEFAVDLEHNQYRSFQGLTCLMQISTRTEDFVIDTLKLRVHIGPHLREVFKDPSKRKVMHGADRDIVWLQRDFGIYVCNMFDTGQASRVLKMERYSLEHLLKHFCGVAANKEYQNADWRLRPLPHVMVKYAREDTHYLLYIYDQMRLQLLMSSAESDSSDPPLIEVYKRSYGICTQLYEKELLTDSSYLHIYGLQVAGLDAQQLAIVSGLYEWRDGVARAEDESTGYILPNRTLIEIAKQMPLTTSKLRRAFKSKHPYIERNLGSVVSIIRHSIQNAAAFEETAEYLKRRLEMANEEKTLPTEESEVLPSEAPEILKNSEYEDENRENGNEKSVSDGYTASVQRESLAVLGQTNKPPTNSSHPVEVTVQALKKPNRAFGALLGSSAKRKFDPDKRVSFEEKEDTKLEHIKSTVSLPFRSFLGGDERLQSDVKETSEMEEVSHRKDISRPATGSSLEDIIVLDDDDSDVEESAKDNSRATASNDQLNQQEDNETSSASEYDEEDEPMPPSDISSTSQKCLQSVDQTRSSEVADKSQPTEDFLELEPLDYGVAKNR